VIYENESIVVIFDRFPVTKMHALVLSRRHVSDFFALDASEKNNLNEALEWVKNYLHGEDSTVAGFNIGMNCGVVAGQTIDHFHAHLIPRRMGDVEDPRGGVRGVIAAKQKY
jgi:diadenosine tetraphosphate (Ap4A) HIT family hydrolase